MKLTKTIKTYLQKKALGGFINQRGNRYESYFAAYKIIQCRNKHITALSSVEFSAQENSFVDDLLIVEAGNRLLYQLKTSQKLGWGSGIKTLNFDFSIQKRIETYHKRRFELILVVSSASLEASLKTSLPKGLKSCTTVLLFPYHDTISKQILQDAMFKSELESLSALKNPATDKLEALAICILGFWEGSSKKGILLSEIITKVENVGYSFIKPRVIHTLSHSTKSILDAIPDFKYLESNSYFAWSYKTTDSGIIPYQIGSIEFNKIETEIQVNKPKAFIDLEMLIS